MTKFVSIILIVACLFALSACQVKITPKLEIPDQSIEDGEVSINLAIDKVGWLVLHPATTDGRPDTSEALSTKYFTAAGEYNNIEATVPLLIGQDRTIFAVLYYDDPIDRQFEPSSDNTSDPQVTNESGALQVSFTLPGKSPYIEITQSATTGIVSITAAIDGAGWLVLRPATAEGEVDTSIVLAKARFTVSGEYPINVTLPDSIAIGSTIFALLHYDNPADRDFTYTIDGTDDPPVQVDGSDVVESLVVNY
jgi:hypothetical protein